MKIMKNTIFRKDSGNMLKISEKLWDNMIKNSNIIKMLEG
jgi:hypothetical protein